MWAKDYLELVELQQIIRAGVEDVVPGTVRVRAEVASVQQRTNGHCYLELCQSDTRSLVAKIRAIIWRSAADDILSRFAKASGSSLQPGMSLIFEARINYSELYGVSLIIEDIDYQSTLGEAELRRRQTLERLDKEGLTDLQKEFAMPRVPYSLAVISAPDAAGYGDFRRHLLENDYGFAFEVTLFPATMQGEGAPDSIIAALNRITGDSENAATGSPLSPLGEQGDGGPEYGAVPRSEQSDRGSLRGSPLSPLGAQGDGGPEYGAVPRYDSILLLRGGGSALDLACFDDYELCAAIARCPIPVFTAIGHDRDVHAADMVACESVKTPTALADLFIDAVAAEDELISSYQSRLKLAFMSKITAREELLNKIQHRIIFALNYLLTAADAALSKLETRIASANPRKLLERGYTLVTDSSGVLLRRASDARPGEEIKVIYSDGTLDCTVNKSS